MHFRENVSNFWGNCVSTCFPHFNSTTGYMISAIHGSFWLQELELALDEERRRGEEARQAAVLLDRKRIQVQTELDELRSLLEAVSANFF